MRGKNHTSISKDEKKPIRFLEKKYHKILLGKFDNCRHSKGIGTLRLLKETLKLDTYYLYTGTGVRTVICIKKEQQEV